MVSLVIFRTLLNPDPCAQLPASLKTAGPSERVTVLYGSETGNAEEQVSLRESSYWSESSLSSR